MKDRVQSLIDTFFCGVDIDKFYIQNKKEKLADWLRENGVIVPPCKVGDTLHDISEYVYGIPCPEIYEVESDRMTIEKAENGDYLFTYEDVYIKHDDIGKTMFFSREEAEQALKGGAE